MKKYTELSKKAQNKAVKDYMEGWEETHPNDPLDGYEVHGILSTDLIHYTYDNDGNLLETNE